MCYKTSLYNCACYFFSLAFFFLIGGERATCSSTFENTVNLHYNDVKLQIEANLYC